MLPNFHAFHIRLTGPGLEKAVLVTVLKLALPRFVYYLTYVRRFVDWCLVDAKYALYVVDNNLNNFYIHVLSHSTCG